MGARALFNFMRKLLPETSFKECDIKSNYYLDLHRKFELSWLISSTVIPVLVFEQMHPLKLVHLGVLSLRPQTNTTSAAARLATRR